MRSLLLACLALCFFTFAHAQRVPPWQSLNDEAQALFQQGKYEQSIAVARKGLEMVEQRQSAEHQGAAVFLNRIAECYRLMARFELAEPLYERSIGIIEKTLGPDHARMGQVLSNFGVMRVAQGRNAEAEKMLLRSIAIREREQGADVAGLAQTLGSLGHVYMVRGEVDKAEAALKRGVEISEKARGPEHADVARNLSGLAALYTQQRRFRDRQRAHVARRQKCGRGYRRATGPRADGGAESRHRALRCAAEPGGAPCVMIPPAPPLWSCCAG